MQAPADWWEASSAFFNLHSKLSAQAIDAYPKIYPLVLNFAKQYLDLQNGAIKSFWARKANCKVREEQFEPLNCIYQILVIQ